MGQHHEEHEGTKGKHDEPETEAHAVRGSGAEDPADVEAHASSYRFDAKDAPIETEAHAMRGGYGAEDPADVEAHSAGCRFGAEQPADVEAHLAMPDTTNEAPPAQDDDDPDVEGHAARWG